MHRDTRIGSVGDDAGASIPAIAVATHHDEDLGLGIHGAGHYRRDRY
jgi:hypothetical protein